MNVYAVQFFKRDNKFHVYYLKKNNNYYIWQFILGFTGSEYALEFIKNNYINPIVISQKRRCHNNHIKFLKNDMSMDSFRFKELEKRLKKDLK